MTIIIIHDDFTDEFIHHFKFDESTIDDNVDKARRIVNDRLTLHPTHTLTIGSPDPRLTDRISRLIFDPDHHVEITTN